MLYLEQPAYLRSSSCQHVAFDRFSDTVTSQSCRRLLLPLCHEAVDAGGVDCIARESCWCRFRDAARLTLQRCPARRRPSSSARRPQDPAATYLIAHSRPGACPGLRSTCPGPAGSHSQHREGAGNNFARQVSAGGRQTLGKPVTTHSSCRRCSAFLDLYDQAPVEGRVIRPNELGPLNLHPPPGRGWYPLEQSGRGRGRRTRHTASVRHLFAALGPSLQARVLPVPAPERWQQFRSFLRQFRHRLPHGTLYVTCNNISRKGH